MRWGYPSLMEPIVLWEVVLCVILVDIFTVKSNARRETDRKRKWTHANVNDDKCTKRFSKGLYSGFMISYLNFIVGVVNILKPPYLYRLKLPRLCNSKVVFSRKEIRLTLVPDETISPSIAPRDWNGFHWKERPSSSIQSVLPYRKNRFWIG